MNRAGGDKAACVPVGLCLAGACPSSRGRGHRCRTLEQHGMLAWGTHQPGIPLFSPPGRAQALRPGQGLVLASQLRFSVLLPGFLSHRGISMGLASITGKRYLIS